MTTNKKSESKNAITTEKSNQEIVAVNEQPIDVEQKSEITTSEPVVTTGEKSTTTKEPASTTPEPVKNPTKADRARGIYNEMILDPANGRNEIAARIKQELCVSKSAGQTYFYQFQRETARVVEKPETKVDKAKPLYEKLVLEGKTRKQIIEAFVNEIDLTPAGASTYYQNLKRDAEKSNPK